MFKSQGLQEIPQLDLAFYRMDFFTCFTNFLLLPCEHYVFIQLYLLMEIFSGGIGLRVLLGGGGRKVRLSSISFCHCQVQLYTNF